MLQEHSSMDKKEFQHFYKHHIILNYLMLKVYLVPKLEDELYNRNL